MSMSSISTKAATCTLFYKRCKEICDKTHTNCHIKRVKKLPTRLLYVTPAPSGTAAVQLVSSVDMGLPPDTEFAALSYCWGKNYRLRLLATNYRDLTVDTPFDQLPATIQDAVLVTVELGLQYLWVDALCIMQDSHEDWSNEAARMCDIYEGCSIVLAASGAPDSEQGLHTVRDPLLQTPCILSGNLKVSTGRMKLESYRVLETRGWAMQEHLLPSRSINFGSYVYWTCRELSVDEFGRYKSEEHLGAATQEFFPLVLKPAMTDPVDAPRMRLLWWRIWTKYMEAGLSRKTDNLAAISGIISAIERRTGWTSVHGLWEPFIIQELLWFKSWPVELEPTGVGPSWSWASRYRGLRAEPPDTSKEWKDVAEYVPMDERDQPSSPAVIELSGVLCRTYYHSDFKRYIRLRVEGWPAPISAKYDERSWQAGDMALPLCLKGKGCVHGLVVAPTRKSMTYERVGYFLCGCGSDLAKTLQRSDGEPFVRRKILLE
ncbi:hypothetical protein VP1G_11159 [Cytospora mali]|uniref:Heterokaryon incompatibility domain-containing protein n=1 Tax=Cytospora mali TaxID=578113 RepID=A0A194VA56_CYTMA|nr:hypothetical protein VP1G_11159 [Valsa mali var. pyri (nom. inval.)]